MANANAQLASADTPAGKRQGDVGAGQRHPAGRAGQAGRRASRAEPQVVAADQLNDVDRALRESRRRRSQPLAMASAEAPAAPVAPVDGQQREAPTWDQTSLIGKIFIGFGALLTMASAARMFMA